MPIIEMKVWSRYGGIAARGDCTLASGAEYDLLKTSDILDFLGAGVRPMKPSPRAWLGFSW